MDVFLDVNMSPWSHRCANKFSAVKNEFKDHLYKIRFTYGALFLKQLQNGVVVQNVCSRKIATTI